MLIGIDHAVLLVTDAQSSLSWYQDHLGLAPERLAEWEAGEVPFVSLRVTDTFIIDLFEGKPSGTNVDHLAFTTDRSSFDAFCVTHKAIVERSSTELFGAQGIGHGVYFRDPDGHLLELRTYE